MGKITNELKAQFFPLLDDMGGMEEIYTIEELRQRMSFANGAKPEWKAKWLKGFLIHHNMLEARKELTYYDCVVAFIWWDGERQWNYD